MARKAKPRAETEVLPEPAPVAVAEPLVPDPLGWSDLPLPARAPKPDRPACHCCGLSDLVFRYGRWNWTEKIRWEDAPPSDDWWAWYCERCCGWLTHLPVV